MYSVMMVKEISQVELTTNLI